MATPLSSGPYTIDQDNIAIMAEIQADAPPGWAAYYLTSVSIRQVSENRRANRREYAYDEMMDIFRQQEAQQARDERKAWRSPQKPRAVRMETRNGQPFKVLSDFLADENFYPIASLYLPDLRETLPDARAVYVQWLIHVPYIQPDIDASAKVIIPPPPTKAGPVSADDSGIIRSYVREQLKRDPSADFDYAAMARSFGIDKRWARLIVSQERKAAAILPPVKPQSKTDLARKMLIAGKTYDQIQAALAKENISIARSGLTSLAAKMRKAGQLGPVQPIQPVAVVQRPVITRKPVQQAQRPVSKAATIRDLLKAGMDYRQIESELEKRGIAVHKPSIRREASMLKKGKK